jgi:hypothetical protein
MAGLKSALCKGKVYAVHTNCQASTGGLHEKYQSGNMTFHKLGQVQLFCLSSSRNHCICILTLIYLPNSMESLEPPHQHHRVHTTNDHILVILFVQQFLVQPRTFTKKWPLHFLHNLKLFLCVGLGAAAEAGKVGLFFETGEEQDCSRRH